MITGPGCPNESWSLLWAIEDFASATNVIDSYGGVAALFRMKFDCHSNVCILSCIRGNDATDRLGYLDLRTFTRDPLDSIGYWTDIFASGALALVSQQGLVDGLTKICALLIIAVPLLNGQ